MDRTITSEDLLRWLERCITTLHEQAAYLTKLDAAIGDADHGTNMDRGFQAIQEKLPTLRAMDSAALLKAVGSTLVSTVGGASGPLYGTAFLRGGMAVAGKSELTTTDIVTLLEAFFNGVVVRGKARVGEKTMLDALSPALAAAQQALADQATLPELLTRASAAAEDGMKATIPMQATRGRASYLGERSIGHQDPGATSSWLILRSLAEIVSEPTV